MLGAVASVVGAAGLALAFVPVTAAAPESAGPPVLLASGGGGTCPAGYLYAERSIDAAPPVGHPATAMVVMGAATTLSEQSSHVSSEIWVGGSYHGNTTWIEAGIEWYYSDGGPRIFIAHQNDSGVFTWDYEAPAALDTAYPVYVENAGGNRWFASVGDYTSATFTIHIGWPSTDFGGESYLGTTGTCNTLSDLLAVVGPWSTSSLYENSDPPYRVTSVTDEHTLHTAARIGVVL